MGQPIVGQKLQARLEQSKAKKTQRVRRMSFVSFEVGRQRESFVLQYTSSNRSAVGEEPLQCHAWLARSIVWACAKSRDLFSARSQRRIVERQEVKS